MPTSASGNVFTISPQYSFVDVLADWLLTRFHDEPEGLGQVRILLPSMRASRALQAAFLKQGDGRPLILPKTFAIGGLEGDELMLGDVASLERESPSDRLLFTLPPMDAKQRLLILTRLVMTAGDSLAPRQMARSGDISSSSDLAMTFQQALRMAQGLGHLMDQAETEGVALERLTQLEVSAELAHHWQESARFITLISEVWPKLLTAFHMTSAAVLRREQLERQVHLWQRNPPQSLTIAAGSTGSIPSTRILLAAVSQLDQGMLILPGLDQLMPDEAWQAVADEASHPQYNLKRLLEACGLEREHVQPLKPLNLSLAPGRQATKSARLSLLSYAMMPAASAHLWRELSPGGMSLALGDNRDDFCEIRAEDKYQEAKVVAVLMREVLETPGKTAALITPDRLLARRVIVGLRRWSIEVDDSAGQPLKNTSAGLLLRQSAQCMMDGLAPASLMALLKHPFSLIDPVRERNKRLLYAFERAYLRGQRPAFGLAGLQARLQEHEQEQQGRGQDLPEALMTYGQSLIQALSGLMSLGQDPDAAWPFRTFLVAHMGLLDKLDLEQRLWRQGAHGGEALADFLNKLLLALDAEGEALPPITAKSYFESLEALISGETVRQAYGQHPRLYIWGTMEGRLQLPDRVILGGLLEGSWPAPTDTGPWLSRPMRYALDLPSTERKVGLASHDFVQACGADEVYLTYALKESGAETRSSRLVQRLGAVMAKVGLQFSDRRAEQVQSWVKALDAPPNKRKLKPFFRPFYAPPVARRPFMLPITDVETLFKDPYSLYLKHVLKIGQLDALDQQIDVAARGNIIHAVLEHFLRTQNQELLPDQALNRLMRLGREAFEALNVLAPAGTAFWWPRFRRVARWFLAQEQARRAQGKRVSFMEVSGAADVGGWQIYGRADRIDWLNDDTFEIIDYKTGSAPTKKEMKLLSSPQLLLEALILATGGFRGFMGDQAKALGLGALPLSLKPSRAFYWQLKGDGREAAILTGLVDEGHKVDLTEALDALEQRLMSLAIFYADPQTAYECLPDPALAPRFQPYGTITREAEWRVPIEEETSEGWQDG